MGIEAAIQNNIVWRNVQHRFGDQISFIRGGGAWEV
jgi:hypothetical protein